MLIVIIHIYITGVFATNLNNLPTNLENPSDTLFIRMNPVTVTAERTQASLASVTLATSVIDHELIQSLPLNHLTDALSVSAGMMMVQRDGLGWQSDLMVRGFYGGGEAEYVLLLLDGQPMNSVGNGLVNWLEVPVHNLERIEIVRGGLGALYGDAALGGVVNLITNSSKKPTTSLSVAAGSFGTSTFGLSHNNSFLGHRYKMFLSNEKTDGYRDNSNGSNFQLGGSLNLVQTEKLNVDIHSSNHLQTVQESGPLPSDSLTSNRLASELPFKEDGTSEISNKLGLRAQYNLSKNHTLSVDAWYDRKDQSKIRTLPVMSINLQEHGIEQELRVLDTQERVSNSNRYQANAQLTGVNYWGNKMSRWILGSNIGHATLDDKYYDVFFGSLPAYTDMPDANQDILLTQSTTNRQSLALYAQETVYLTKWLKIAGGGRFDKIHDTSDNTGFDKTEKAFSPFLGVNVQYVNNEHSTGHFYVNASNAFKTPTLDQRFDQRLVRMPFDMNDTTGASFGGYAFYGIVDTVTFPPISNAELNPQYSNNLEFGFQHLHTLNPNVMDLRLSASIYTMDVRNEFDFSFETFSYINIGKSKHTGLELEGELDWYSKGRVFANYTYQDVVAKSGSFKNKNLKAIPKQFISGGFALKPTKSLTVSLVGRLFKDAYLDDANTVKLKDYSSWDSKVSYKMFNLTFSLDIRNVLDASFESTGYPDPTPGSSMQYYFPSASRSYQFGVQTTF